MASFYDHHHDTLGLGMIVIIILKIFDIVINLHTGKYVEGSIMTDKKIIL